MLGGTSYPANIILRGMGPSLAQRGISNPLADPTLELHNGNGDKIGFNDNWNDDAAQAAKINAAGIAPSNQLEAAIATTLPAGSYTVILAEKNGCVGVGLVEIYRVP